VFGQCQVHAQRLTLRLLPQPGGFEDSGSTCPLRLYGVGGVPVRVLGDKNAVAPPAPIRRVPPASITACFQPHPGSEIPSGLANAAISATTTPTRATTIPICLLDIAAGDYLAEGRGREIAESARSRGPPIGFAQGKRARLKLEEARNR